MADAARQLRRLSHAYTSNFVLAVLK